MSAHVNGSAKPRFELPMLDLNFGSITDGTSIPPPPVSPKVPTPPQTPPPTRKPVAIVHNATANRNGNGKENGLVIGVGNELQTDKSTSPNDGNLTSLEIGSRPPSRATSSVMGGRKSRRNSWFKLFRGGESKRSSVLLDDSTLPRKHAGPPPPMIPELKDLEKDEGSLGNDLFKNIRG